MSRSLSAGGGEGKKEYVCTNIYTHVLRSRFNSHTAPSPTYIINSTQLYIYIYISTSILLNCLVPSDGPVSVYPLYALSRLNLQ